GHRARRRRHRADKRAGPRIADVTVERCHCLKNTAGAKPQDLFIVQRVDTVSPYGDRLDVQRWVRRRPGRGIVNPQVLGALPAGRVMVDTLPLASRRSRPPTIHTAPSPSTATSIGTTGIDVAGPPAAGTVKLRRPLPATVVMTPS